MGHHALRYTRGMDCYCAEDAYEDGYDHGFEDGVSHHKHSPVEYPSEIKYQLRELRDIGLGWELHLNGVPPEIQTFLVFKNLELQKLARRLLEL